jgi:hypothetical protein
MANPPKPHLPEIPGFRDVEQKPDGTWTAVHKASGEVITAPTFEHLERVEAPVVRLTYAWPWLPREPETTIRTGDRR